VSKSQSEFFFITELTFFFFKFSLNEVPSPEGKKVTIQTQLRHSLTH